MSAVTGNRPARVEMNQPVKSCKFAFSFTQIQWLVLIRLVTDSIIKSHFCSHFDVFGAVFGVCRKHSAASRRTVYELRSGEHTRHGCCWTRLASGSCVCDGHRSLEISMRPLFSARARKIAPRAGALPQLRSFRFSPAFIREDQSAKPPTGAIGRLRSPFFILAFLGS